MAAERHALLETELRNSRDQLEYRVAERTAALDRLCGDLRRADDEDFDVVVPDSLGDRRLVEVGFDPDLVAGVAEGLEQRVVEGVCTEDDHRFVPLSMPDPAGGGARARW